MNGRTINFQGITDDGGTPDTDKAAAAKIAASDIFAVVPTVASDLAGANDLVNSQMPYFGQGVVLRLLWQRVRLRVLGLHRRERAHHDMWGKAVKQGFAIPNPLGNTAAVLTDNSPAGQYTLQEVGSG